MPDREGDAPSQKVLTAEQFQFLHQLSRLCHLARMLATGLQQGGREVLVVLGPAGTSQPRVERVTPESVRGLERRRASRVQDLHAAGLGNLADAVLRRYGRGAAEEAAPPQECPPGQSTPSLPPADPDGREPAP